MDITKVPKQFLDNVNGGFTEEFFVLGMFSGEAANIYALTPQHMKRILQWAKDTVSRYEEQYGEIKADWKPGIQSPLQASDLNQK